MSEASQVVLQLGDGQRRELALVRVERGPKSLLVKFENVDDRDAAIALVGARLFVDRRALPPLPEGETYLVDLIGFRVIAPDGEVGRVVDVLVNPSIDSVIIELPNGKRAEQALAPTFVERTDVDARCLYLTTREGLIE